VQSEKGASTLRLGYLTSIPQEAVQPVIDVLEAEGVDLEIRRREPPGPFAIAEWLIPSAVVIFAAKSYFDGFLKEVGKDHYALLKKAISASWPAFFGNDPIVQLQLVGSAPNKVPKKPTYSIAFSVMAEAGERKVFKLLLPTDSTREDLETSVGSFLAFVERFHANALEPEQATKLEELSNLGGTFAITYDRTTSRIQILDPRPKS
jgi:hypothetical protein